MENKCLVIIDVQHKFGINGNSRIIKPILNQIALAAFLDYPIILVEFDGYGKTLPTIKNAITKYNHIGKTYIIKKYDSSGVEAITECIEVNDIPVSQLLVCGINIDGCVLYTVEDLAERNPNLKLKVILEGCDSFCDKDVDRRSKSACMSNRNVAMTIFKMAMDKLKNVDLSPDRNVKFVNF